MQAGQSTSLASNQFKMDLRNWKDAATCNPVLGVNWGIVSSNPGVVGTGAQDLRVRIFS